MKVFKKGALLSMTKRSNGLVDSVIRLVSKAHAVERSQEKVVNDMAEKKIAFVGAYERDNFGDLLFALVTDSYLGGYETIYCAPLVGTVDHLLGKSVRDFRDIFNRDDEIDAVWSVGGQLGGARPQSPAHNYPTKPRRGTFGLESPYLPRMTAFAKTATVPFIVNSVDVSAKHSGNPIQDLRVAAALREADFVSTRDRASLRNLERYGVLGTSAPDVVHNVERIVRQAPKSGEVLVQFTPKHFEPSELEGFASWLASSKALDGKKIVFWAAGLAPNHDSLEVYRDLADRAVEINPNFDYSVAEERDPREIARRISAASLVIGTSLHARIVSAAYSIPRVGLDRHKLRSYCSDWDYEMPFDAHVDNLEDRVMQAWSIADDACAREARNISHRNALLAVSKLEESFSIPAEVRALRRLRALDQFAIGLQQLR